MCERVQVAETDARDNLFELRPSVPRNQPRAQFELARGAGGEVGVTSLRGCRHEAAAIVEQVRLAEAGARSDQAGIAAQIRPSFLE